MKIFLTVFFILSLLVSDIKTEGNYTTDTISDKKIKHVETIYGGCNYKRSFDNKSEEELEETCMQSIINDSLSFYVSLEYICCAPFRTQFEIRNGVLCFFIDDVCKNPYKDCYCRCECVYSFDFRLINYEIKKYNYQVILYDPREESPKVIKEGVIDIKDLINS